MLRPVCLGAFLFLTFGIPANAATTKPPPATRVKDVTLSLTLRKDGTSTRTVHYEMQATNEAAAMRMGQISIPYDTALQTLKVVEAHTLKKDGTKIPVRPSAIYDQAAPGAGQVPMFTEFHVRTILFPQFAAGDTAVYTVETTTKKAMLPDQFWYGDVFSPQTAFDDVRETITAPADMKLHIENHDVDFSKTRRGDKIVYSWHYAAPNPAPPETTLVSRFSRTPHFIATTFPSYKALARSYAEVEQPRIVVTPAIQKLADKITDGVSSRREQAKKLYEWVSSHIRYVAVELGRGSLVPHAAPAVLANGYGDCKDHVVLLAALLKAKGIRSEGVLINAGNIYELTKVPTFIGLDHIITYLPEFDLYLDSTAIVAPFGVLPFGEYGKPVVYVSSADPHRGAVPILPQGRADLRTVTTARLARDGTLTGTTTTTGTGPYGISLRYIGLAAQNLGPDNAAAKILAARGYGGDATGTLIAPTPTKLTPSYTVTGRFVAKNWKEEAAGTRRFVLPGGLRVTSETGNSVMGILGNRSLKDDAELPCYSTHASEDISLTAPDGMQFDHVPDDTHVKTAYLRFDAHWTLDGNTMHVHRDFTSRIDQPLCTPDIRKANKAALKEISDSYDSQMSLDPANGQSTTGASGATASNAPDDVTTPELALLLKGGRQDVRNRRSKDAIAKSDQALKLDPKNATAFYYRGIAYAQMGKYARAIRDFDKAIALKPDSADMLSDRGHVYLMMGEDSRALKDLDRAIALDPDYAKAHLNRGAVYSAQHKYEKAIREFGTVIALNPASSYAYANRALAYGHLGQYQRAINDLTKTISLNPNFPKAYATRGAVYAKFNEPQKALSDLDKALDLDPDDVPALQARAGIYGQLYRFDDALADVSKAISLAPHDTNLLMGRASIYQHMADWPHALADCDTALSKPAALPPDLRAAALNMRADVLMELGRYKAAIRDYTAELKVSDYPNARVLRAIAYEWTGRHRKAKADINAAIKEGGKNVASDFATIMADKGNGHAPAATARTAAARRTRTLGPDTAKEITRPTPANAHMSDNYPPLSRRLAEEGRVVVTYTVNTDGSTSDPAIAVSSRFPRLDAAALEAVKPWRYHPAEKDGKPIAVRTKAELTYALH